VGTRAESWLGRVDLLARGAVSRLEATAVGALLLGLGIAVYGPHVVHGGFTLDDWAFRADYERYGYWGLIERLLDIEPGALVTAGSGARLVGASFYATSYAVLGSSAVPHLALAVLLGVLMSFLLFLVLRKLGMERLHAAAIAALVLLFPAADSPRLWPAAAQNELAISLFLLGLLLALGGLERTGRAAVLRHAAAVGCYVLGILCYELVVGGVVLSVLVYRLHAPWRPSVRRWLVDVSVIGVAGLYVRFVGRPQDFEPFSAQIETARTIQSQARTLLSRLGVEDGPPRVPLEAFALVLAAAAALALFLPRTDELRSDLRRWVVAALAGIVAVGAGYAALLPIEGRLPLNVGIGNRTNIGAAIGFVILIYALAVLVGMMVVRGAAAVRPVSHARAWAAGLGVAAALGVGAMWTEAVVDDRRAWARAETIRRETLDALRLVPKPVPSSTVYTFGVAGETAPGVPAFTASWDLTGAVRVLWKDHTLRAIPSASLERGALGHTTGLFGIACEASSVRPGGRYSVSAASAYGEVVFVDVVTGQFSVIGSRDECRAWASRYRLLSS